MNFVTSRYATCTRSRVSNTPPPPCYTTRSRVCNTPLPPPPPSILRSRRRRLDRRRRRRIRWNLHGMAIPIAPESSLAGLDYDNEDNESNRIRRLLHIETMTDALAPPRRRRRIRWNLCGIPIPISPKSSLAGLDYDNEDNESDRIRRLLHIETMVDALAPPPAPEPRQPPRRSARLAALAPPRRSARLALKERVDYRE